MRVKPPRPASLRDAKVSLIFNVAEELKKKGLNPCGLVDSIQTLSPVHLNVDHLMAAAIEGVGRSIDVGSVQTTCLKSLAEIVTFCGGAATAAAFGGMRLALDAMYVHEGDAKIQALGCSLLGGLCAESSSRGDFAVAAGGVQVGGTHAGI